MYIIMIFSLHRFTVRLVIHCNMAIATPTEYGGYEYTFVEPPPNRCICNICHYPSRDPYMTGHCCRGQTICKSCLDNWLVTSGANRCPVCSEAGASNNTYPNYPIEREVKSLHIYCTNKEKGCKWQGELNDINNHLGNSNGCQFEEVKCSNECGKMIERQYLTSHVETECPHRAINCQYCHDTGEHQFIEGQHKEECPKFPLPCPNKCEVGSVSREDMEAHRKECPLEMIQCEYHNVGCEVMIARKEQEKHKNEKMEEHLMKTKLVVTDFKSELNNTKFELDKAKLDLTTTKRKLTNAEATLANTEATLANTNNYLASALQRINTLEVLLYQATVFRPTCGAVVLQSSAKWSVKLATMTIASKSGDQECPVIFKMSQCHNNVIWYSDSFYTHNKGYKMCLRVDAAGNGVGKGTHLSVFLYLMKGPHDHELTWPLRKKFEIKLLNQISDSEHHSMSVTYNDDIKSSSADRVIKGDKNKKGWGCIQFITNEDLHKTTPTCQYLKDYCLFFQVTKL